MRASRIAAIVLCLWLVPGLTVAEEELPDDEFLEFLGAWDEAWTEACEPDGQLPGDDVCETNDNEQDDDDEED